METNTTTTTAAGADARNEVEGALALFGMTAYREPQREVIEATLAGKDVLVLMPTGGGKSLTYQVPALLRQGFVLVISPLISLMQNQVAALLGRGIAAVAINHEMPAAQARAHLDDLLAGTSAVRLLYVAPERAVSAGFLDALVQCYEAGRLQRIAVDECHCLVQWGDNFRPEYSALGDLRQRMPGVPIMALTATATGNVRASIVRSLRLRADYAVFKRSYNRSNLVYAVRPKNRGTVVQDIFEEIVRAGHDTACGIVYCFKKADCEDVAQQLNALFVAHAVMARARAAFAAAASGDPDDFYGSCHPARPTTPGSPPRCAAPPSTSGSPAPSESSSPPSPLAWASTSPTSASSTTTRCQSPSRRIPGERPRRARRPALALHPLLLVRRRRHAALDHHQQRQDRLRPRSAGLRARHQGRHRAPDSRRSARSSATATPPSAAASCSCATLAKSLTPPSVAAAGIRATSVEGPTAPSIPRWRGRTGRMCISPEVGAWKGRTR